MADVKYSDEKKKLMTSDEFIAAAKEKADENLQTQKTLAKDIYDSSYATLENAYKDTEATAATARDRNIINADTAYKLSEMKYGAAEEALAGSGLSGSGLSEYQRAQAYAKSRDEKQASYAEYDKIMREAAYNHDQGKLNADIKYKQDVAGATIDYNNTMTSLGEKELGYDTLEKQAIDSSYNGYIDGINNGTMTFDQIKNDSYWSKLSPEQQKAVETASTVKGYKTRIDNGESIEDVMSSYGYADLSVDAQNEIQGYYASVQAGKTSDANAALGDYLDMALAGYDIDTIVALATANGHYDTLNESGAWTSVTREAKKAADDIADEQKLAIDAIVAGGELDEYESAEDVERHLTAEMIPESEREKIVASWQADNADRDIKNIAEAVFEDGKFTVGGVEITGEMLAKDIKNGVYGDKAQAVVDAYGKALVDNAKKNGSIVDAVYAYEQLTTLGDSDKANEVLSIAQTGPSSKGVREYDVNGYGYMKYVIDGKAYKSNRTIDPSSPEGSALETLNANKTGSYTMVKIGNKYYFRGGTVWFELTPLSSGAIMVGG